MSTTAHLLRVEGVNLGAFVFDTRDLSTVRGASLMLLAAVDDAIKAAGGSCEVLSQGASSGLLRVLDADPREVADDVRTALGSKFPHATFVVDVIAEEEDEFRESAESLLAANRWRQMQAATLSMPQANGASTGSPVCALDNLRPAVAKSGYGAPGGGGGFLSEATFGRREYGRKAKQDFYGKVVARVRECLAQEAGSGPQPDALAALDQSLPDFARDFEAIAVDRLEGRLPLDRKLAVFYADGNRFGSLQAQHCRSAKQQQAFDAWLRRRRDSFLADFLVTEVAGKPADWVNPGKPGGKDDEMHPVVRFETLLWGGDEVLFVMPAALGWRFASFFFRSMAALDLAEAGAGLPQQRLTHAAGLVFCQHHAPIDRIRYLVKDQMVDGLAKVHDRDNDSLVVVALESFDNLGTDLEASLIERYRKAIGPVDTILKAGKDREALHETLDAIAAEVHSLRGSATFARSQLRGLVTDMIRDHQKAAEIAAIKQDPNSADRWLLPRAFRNATEDEKKRILEELLPRFGSAAALWIQLEELWDYARP